MENKTKLKIKSEFEAFIYFNIIGKCECGNDLIIDKNTLKECYTFECLSCNSKKYSIKIIQE